MTAALDLARRAVACAGWRWMPGMLCLTDEDGYAARVLIVGLKASTSETADAYSGGGIITRGCLKDDSLPDLNDPATLGCLEQLTCDAYGKDVSTERGPYGCGIFIPWLAEGYYPVQRAVGSGKDKAEALVAALEAAAGEVEEC